MSEEGISKGSDAEASVNEALLPRFRQAFERVLPELLAIPASEVGVVNLDVQAAVTRVLGLVPRIRELRTDLVKIVHPDFDLSRYDRIEDYALALGHAHGVFLVASEPTVSPEALGEEALEVRKTLVKDAEALVQRTWLSKDRLLAIGGRTGYRNIAFDLMAFVALFREHWPVIGGKTGVTLAELQDIETLADELLTAVGTREATKESKGSAAEKRNRAFRGFTEAYDDVQRLVGFARWKQDDAHEIAPSLYSGKGPGSKEQVEPSEPEPTFPDSIPPAQAETTAAGSSASGTPAGESLGPSTGNANRGDVKAAAAAVRSLKEGLRGGSPFEDE